MSKSNWLFGFFAAALAVSGCESNSVSGYFAQIPASSDTNGTPTSNPSTTNPIVTALPNPPDTGVGVGKGLNGAGNIIVYGDEWAARFGSDENITNSTGNSEWGSIQPNLTCFWNDALSFLTANSATKRVLFARFNNAGTTWDVIAANSWHSYLPNLSTQYTFTDYDPSTPLTASYLNNFDAFIFVSYRSTATDERATDELRRLRRQHHVDDYWIRHS